MNSQMLSLCFILATLIAVATSATLQINTPLNVVQCQPVLITWAGGTSPYFVTYARSHCSRGESVLPGGQPSSSALVDFGEQGGTSLTWVVNIAAGTSVGVSVRDATGSLASSAPFTIGSNSDSSCLRATPTNPSAESTATPTSTTSDISFTSSFILPTSTSDPALTTGTNGSPSDRSLPGSMPTSTSTIVDVTEGASSSSSGTDGVFATVTSSEAPISSSTTIRTSKSNSSGSKTRTAAIVAGVVGGLVTFGAVFLCVRWKRLFRSSRIHPSGRIERIVGGASGEATTGVDFSTMRNPPGGVAASTNSRWGNGLWGDERIDPGNRYGNHVAANRISTSGPSQHSILMKSTEPVYVTHTRPTECPEGSASENGTVPTTNPSPSFPQGSGRPVQKGSQIQQIEREPNVQSSTESAGVVPQPGSERLLPSSIGGNAGSDPSSAQTLSLMMREVDNLRTRMAEVLRRQQLESSRDSRLSGIAPSEGDGSQTAPPAYSEDGML